MMREVKMVFKMVGPNSCRILCETRDNGGRWCKQGTIPQAGTLEEVMALEISCHERFGWTMYDITEENTLTFWKEF